MKKTFLFKSIIATVAVMFALSLTSCYDKQSDIFVESIAGDGQTILIESITIIPATVDLCVGDSFQLDAKVLPANATNQTLAWESSNDKVTVDLWGKIKAITVGTATITATAKDGSEVKAECTVTVKNRANDKLEYTKSDYYQWDAYAPADKTDTGTWGANSSHFHSGTNVTAEQSCKGLCDLETAKRYLSQDIYWDEVGPKYTVDGKSYTTGLWIMKKEFIPQGALESDFRKSKKLSEENDTELVKSIRSGEKYFFLPAAGTYSSFYYFFTGEGSQGAYWLATSYKGNKDDLAYSLSFNEGTANVSETHRDNAFLRLIAE